MTNSLKQSQTSLTLHQALLGQAHQPPAHVQCDPGRVDVCADREVAMDTEMWSIPQGTNKIWRAGSQSCGEGGERTLKTSRLHVHLRIMEQWISLCLFFWGGPAIVLSIFCKRMVLVSRFEPLRAQWRSTSSYSYSDLLS